ncbi:methionyl-tRNA formyltransferase [Actinomycetaceae bacterium L2_0104]
MRILFAGTPETAVPSLRRLIADGHEVAAVLTRAPARAGRKHRLVQSAVHTAADELGIPVLTPATLRDEGIQHQIEELAPEAVAVVAYGLLVPQALLGVPAHGWINLHFSVLPSWRGAAPVQYAIWHGDDVTGASTFRLEKGLDTGPVLGVVTEPILPRDTSGELLDRLAASGSELLSRTFELLEDGSAVAQPQQGEPTFAPTIKTSETRVDWTRPAVAVDRQIRAHTPAPGAWTVLNGSRVKLGPVTPAPDQAALAPGEIKDGLVGTGSHPIRLGWVAPAGKKAMDAQDWLRGARLADGTRFDAEGEE